MGEGWWFCRGREGNGVLKKGWGSCVCHLVVMDKNMYNRKKNVPNFFFLPQNGDCRNVSFFLFEVAVGPQ